MRAHCIAQGTLLNALWWYNWKEIQNRGDICKHRANSFYCTVEANTTL